MQKVNFYDTQNVLAEDLNDISYNLGSQSIYRSMSPLGDSGGYGEGNSYTSGSVPGGGIYGSPFDFQADKNFRSVKSTDTIIIVHPGAALDVNGNLIRLLSYVSINKGVSTVNFKWTSSPNTQNYVKLSYQEIPGSFKTDDYGVSHPTRYYGSYYILVDSAVPTSTEILLSTFTSNSSGGIEDTSLVDRRMYARTLTSSDAVSLDPTTKPVSTWTSVEDHIQAKGGGTQTATNPHGLTTDDIEGTSAERHIELAHTNGITLNNIAGNNSWKASIGGISSNIQFTAPSYATASIGGKLFSSSLPTFSTLGTSNGFYYVVTDSTGSVSLKAYTDTTLDNKDSDYMKICAIEVSGGGNVATLYDNPLKPHEIGGDCRRFNTIDQTQIRVDLEEISEVPSDFVTDGRHKTLLDNLNRIRYQLGRAINHGTSSAGWKSTTFPLTDGTSSVADSCHTHSQFSATISVPSPISVGGTSLSSSQISLLTAGTSSVADSIHTHSQFFSPLQVGSVSLTDTELGILTAGTSSVADSLHTHSQFLSPLQVGSVSLTDTELGILTAGTSSVADSIHTHSQFPSTISVPTPINIGSVILSEEQLGILLGGVSSIASSLHTHNSGSSPFNIGISTITEDQVNTLVTSGSVADSLHTHSSFPDTLLIGSTSITESNLSTLTSGPLSDASNLHYHDDIVYGGYYGQQSFVSVPPNIIFGWFSGNAKKWGQWENMFECPISDEGLVRYSSNGYQQEQLIRVPSTGMYEITLHLDDSYRCESGYVQIDSLLWNSTTSTTVVSAMHGRWQHLIGNAGSDTAFSSTFAGIIVPMIKYDEQDINNYLYPRYVIKMTAGECRGGAFRVHIKKIGNWNISQGW